MRLTLAGLLSLLAATAAADTDLARHVNPFTGTEVRAADFGFEEFLAVGGAGNTFPGAAAPFGMIQWSPDTVPSDVNHAGGYTYRDTRMRGFSLTHLSGAGCAIFQDVPILPTTVPLTVSPSVAGSYDVAPAYVPSFSHADEQAAPGWYRVRLDPGTPRAIDVELAARTRSAVGSFTYLPSTTASVLFNAGGSAMANRRVGLAIDPVRREVSGTVAAGQFCYHRNRYALHFIVQFSRPFAAWGTWRDQTLSPGSRSTSAESANPLHFRLPGFPHTSNGAQAGAWVAFDTTSDPVVAARVGISFTSLEGARLNLDVESPDFDLEAARDETRAAWNALLGRIEVEGGAPETTRTFYTMLYHALLAPSAFSDADGSYLGMDGQVHETAGRTKYANFSGWDIYRSQIPLLALLDPERTSDMVWSLLADARESGWLPRWPVASGQTDVMVGDPAAPIIASAWALGARDFDAREALRALRKGATETGRSPNADYMERQGLADYLRLGWLPHDGTERSSAATTTMFGDTAGVWGSAATTLEYAVADFAIARFAAALGELRTYRTFMRRSGGWRHLVNSASGYLEPRYASGAFKPGFDPLGLEGFAEGNAAQYTWMVPFDPAGLVAALGGRPGVVARLDRHLERLNEGPASPYAFLGNEPELGVPWLYDWLGQPWKTQRVVREALRTLYDDTPAGYVGNDDLGTMSAWYVFAALGFYPAVPGEDLLVLASPLFPRATLHLPGGNVVVRAPRAAPDRPYVRGVRLDGQRHDRPWLRFRAVACGGRLDVDLARRPSPSWGRAPRDAPPSFPPSSRFPGKTGVHPCHRRQARQSGRSSDMTSQ